MKRSGTFHPAAQSGFLSDVKTARFMPGALRPDLVRLGNHAFQVRSVVGLDINQG